MRRLHRGAYGADVPVKVRDAIKQLEAQGWRLARTGIVTIPGKPSDVLRPKTWASIMRQAGMKDDR